eukprot:NODE_31423_length_397_cov_0.918519.p1 GENE.NODE_31423_length_397_cov_0.918519~~NODE_31423_length_397_cov_0.918519.p1  ORF type:complete len:83 (+),score=9.31 NODE_31423_length_397_cov_0.918519:110-358(+)
MRGEGIFVIFFFFFFFKQKTAYEISACLVGSEAATLSLARTKKGRDRDHGALVALDHQPRPGSDFTIVNVSVTCPFLFSTCS